jgi:rubredoxin
MSDAKARYVCTGCGWVYDPVEGDPGRGVPPGTLFADLPDTWECPMCYLPKESFEPE